MASRVVVILLGICDSLDTMRYLRQAVLLIGLAVAQGSASPPASEIHALYVAGVRTFFLVRSGTAVNDAATGISHPASHFSDATADHRNLSGGWYNAGDYGKWSMMAAISVSYMLHLHGLQDVRHKADPMLLTEATWGLDWLLKMQDQDGGVRHKIDGGTVASLSAAWGKSPDRDPNVRIATPASTIATADFAAVMYQASHAFEHGKPAYAARLRESADSAYAWMERHPDVGANDPFYGGDNPSQSMMWARCERILVRRDLNTERAVQLQLANTPATEAGWQNPSLLGYFSLASSDTASHSLREAALQAIVRAANAIAKDAAGRRFRVALADNEYYWGSVEHLLHRTTLLLIADSLHPEPALRQAALDQLSFILGNNAVDHSFVTAFGAHPVEHPWHWAYSAFGKVMPGWAVLGPNGYPEGVDPELKRLQQQGTPPEKCYVDRCDSEGSWASNEGEITEEAALIFVTGYLDTYPTR